MSRNINTPSTVKRKFKFASRKNDALVTCESNLEFNACFHLELDETVVSFRSQPETFKYFHKGEFSYTPDMEVVYDDGTIQYQEYKPKEKFLSDFQEKFSAMQEAAEKKGVELIYVSENHIDKQPLLDNLKLLKKYSNPFFSSPLSKTHIEFPSMQNDDATLSELAKYNNVPEGELRAYICSLIIKGALDIDIETIDLMTDFVV